MSFLYLPRNYKDILITYPILTQIMQIFSLRPIPDVRNTYRGTRVEREVPEMLTYLQLWGSNATQLWIVHITLGVIATFFSLLTASMIGHIDDQYSRIFGFIAALSISLLTAFNLGAKSNNTRNAWRRLNLAILKFNEHMITKDGLITAYEQGESLIGGVNHSQDRIQREELVTDNEINEVRKPHTDEESEDKDKDKDKENENKHAKKEK
jgi:hypothetical protein